MLISSVFYANSSETKHSPEDESWHPEELKAVANAGVRGSAQDAARVSRENIEGLQAARGRTPEQQQTGSRH